MAAEWCELAHSLRPFQKCHSIGWIAADLGLPRTVLGACWCASCTIGDCADQTVRCGESDRSAGYVSYRNHEWLRQID